MKRKSGFYWVKTSGIWYVAYWGHISNYWRMPGHAEHFFDSDFEEISSDRIPEPNE